MTESDKERFTKQAEAEWQSNHDGCNGNFSSKANYVAWRVNQLNRDERAKRNRR
ncbi:MAG: hypothetical protein QM754_12025 [Tepidisphaeraceae bacterium]